MKALIMHWILRRSCKVTAPEQCSQISHNRFIHQKYWEEATASEHEIKMQFWSFHRKVYLLAHKMIIRFSYWCTMTAVIFCPLFTHLVFCVFTTSNAVLPTEKSAPHRLLSPTKHLRSNQVPLIHETSTLLWKRCMRNIQLLFPFCSAFLCWHLM